MRGVICVRVTKSLYECRSETFNYTLSPKGICCALTHPYAIALFRRQEMVNYPGQPTWAVSSHRIPAVCGRALLPAAALPDAASAYSDPPAPDTPACPAFSTLFPARLAHESLSPDCQELSDSQAFPLWPSQTPPPRRCCFRRSSPRPSRPHSSPPAHYGG